MADKLYKCKCGAGPFVESYIRRHIFDGRKDPKGTHGWVKYEQPKPEEEPIVTVAEEVTINKTVIAEAVAESTPESVSEAVATVVLEENHGGNGSSPDTKTETVADKIRELENIAAEFNVKLVDLVRAVKGDTALIARPAETTVFQIVEPKHEVSLAYTLPEAPKQTTLTRNESKPEAVKTNGKWSIPPASWLVIGIGILLIIGILIYGFYFGGLTL